MKFTIPSCFVVLVAISALPGLIALKKKPLDNIALNKETKVSSLWSPGRGQKYRSGAGAVNGIIYPVSDEKIGKFQCTATNKGDKNPWWAVDLGQNHLISSIQVYFRNDCCKNQFSKVYVEVIKPRNKSTNKWDALKTGKITCDHYQDNPITFLSIKCPDDTVGRFVKIRKDSEYLTICEVQVYSQPKEGKPLDNVGKCKCNRNSNRIAFSVKLTKMRVTISKQDKIVKFDTVMLNQGRGYDVKTGTFTAPRKGIYQFSVTIMSDSGKYLFLNLTKNGALVVRIYAATIHGASETANPILKLKQGDKVAVEFDSSMGKQVLHGNHFSYFSGHLI